MMVVCGIWSSGHHLRNGHKAVCLWTFLIWALCGSSAASVTLRIGVPDGYIPTVEAALLNTNYSYPVELLPLASANTETDLERFNATFTKLQRLNVHAVISPFYTGLNLATDTLNIPYICTTHQHWSAHSNNIFQIIPDLDLSSKALLDIIKAFEWTEVSVFYDDFTGVSVLENLITSQFLKVRAWRLPKQATVQDINAALVEMRTTMVREVVVLCRAENIDKLLNEARNLAILSTPPFKWLFFDPGVDARAVYTRFDQIFVNFTIVSLLDFNDTLGSSSNYSNIHFALASDALQLLTSSLSSVLANHGGTPPDHVIRSQLSAAIVNNTEFGHTGPLSFNNDGHRDNVSFTLSVVNGPKNDVLGRWYSKKSKFEPPLQLNGAQLYFNFTSIFPLHQRTVKVVLIKNAPFTMLKSDHESRTGNDRFEGYSVDLTYLLAEMLEFEFEIYLVPDDKFGSLNHTTGQWNGVMWELLSGAATMSLAPLSINAEREQAVDFSKPFMSRYLSVLMRRPQLETSYFEFLSPFSTTVWLCIMAAFVVVAAFLFGLETLARHGGRFVQVKGDPSDITIRESFWFVFGSLLQGSVDSTPRTIPGRILTSAWWFFALILISSYTANLAAFLTVKKINSEINSVADLAGQTEVKYGTVMDSGVTNFFTHTTNELFSKMWTQMNELDTDSMVSNMMKGIQKAKDEDYAFFWDTTTIRYVILEECDLMEIGPAFDHKTYGIGVPPGATYLDDLSLAILQLSDSGKLHELETAWWGGSDCPEVGEATADETSSLQIENVAGVFFILVGGILIAVLECLVRYLSPVAVKKSKAKLNQRRRKREDDDGVDAEEL